MKSILRYCVRVQNNRLNNQPNNITIYFGITIHRTSYKLSYKNFDFTFVYE